MKKVSKEAKLEKSAKKEIGDALKKAIESNTNELLVLGQLKEQTAMDKRFNMALVELFNGFADSVKNLSSATGKRTVVKVVIKDL